MFKREYKTLNLIRVSRQALKNNFDFFQKLNPQAKICLVLKSNAYGHGLKLIGGFVDKEIKPEFICVDSLYEAYELQKINIKTPVLILGYTLSENFKYNKLNFRIPVWDNETLKILNQYQPGIKVHIKVDTGMNRLGLKENDVDRFIAELFTLKGLNCSKITVEGIYSHLAEAENESLSQKQIALFKKIIRKFESSGFIFKYKHICATDGALKDHDPEFNLIRLGLGFYKNALKLVSHLVQIKEIDQGEIVGYGQTFKAKRKMKIGILPLGYYDGLDRRFSNKGIVKIENQFCKPYVGQEAIVFDNDQISPNSIQNSANLMGTIPYELLVKLSESTRRILI